VGGIANTVTISPVTSQDNSWYEKGQEYDSQGYYADALECYEKALGADGENVDIQKAILQDYQQLGDEYQFKTSAEQLLNQTGGDRDVYIWLIKYYAKEEDYKEAYDYAQEGLERFPKNKTLQSYYEQLQGIYDQTYYNYEEISDYKDGIAIAKKNGSDCLIDSTGAVVAGEEQEGTIMDVQVNKNGNVALYSICQDGVTCYRDANGYLRISPKQSYDYLGCFSDGYALVKRDGYIGYLDENMKETEESYEDATAFYDGVAAVKKNGKWAFLDSSMQLLTDYIYTDVAVDSFCRCSVSGNILAEKEDGYVLVDRNGNVLSEVYEDAEPFLYPDGVAAVYRDGGWGLIDGTGKELLSCDWEMLKSGTKELAAVCQEGLWGYLNTDGTLFLKPQFAEAKAVNGSGYATVLYDGQWSLIRFYKYNQNEW
jgi:tetratricopeptide (TPR) repeat protein